jgi:hypothetical protein
VSSHRRHVTYCQRNLDRPRKRGKSCRECSRAKTKCSFHSHCFRCVSKGLECVYDSRSVSRPQPGSSTRSIQSEDLSLLNFGENAILEFSDIANFEQNTNSIQSQDLSILNFGDNGILDHSDILPFDQSLHSVRFEDLPIVNSRDDILISYADNQNYDQRPGSRSIDQQNELATFTNSGQSSTLKLSTVLPLDYLTINNFAANYVASMDSVGTLAHFRISDPVSRQGATLVMQALRAIPESMLRRETFPPFIHPQLHRQDLAEPLAICMRIAHLFATQTSDIGSFVWRTIRTEQIRVLEEV